MLFSNSRDSIKTVHILDTMLSSFNIFPKETAEDFSVYENSTFGINISYPDNWIIKKHQEKYPLTNIADFYPPENEDFAQISLYSYDLSVLLT